MLNQQHLQTLLGFETCSQKENPFRPMLSADRESLETFLNCKKPCLILDSKAHARPTNSTLFNDSLRLTDITKKQREKPTSPLFSLSLASSRTALNPRVFLNLKPSSNPKTSERHQTKQTTTHNPQQYPNKRSISLPPQKLQLHVQPRLLECLEPNKLWNRHKSTKQCLQW